MRGSSADEITAMSASRLCEFVRRRVLSPVEIMEAHLARAATLNAALNAIVTFAPDALEQARAAERALMGGDSLPPLHGLPLTIKDTISTRGLRTTSGSRTRIDYVPEADAAAVARLRAAGAIVFGKTNASELALEYNADNLLFGRTNNPHDFALTPGGSSGGCAAAVSACLSPASLGSDLVGSIRIPAHFCGIAGLFPTPGRVPSGGHFPPTDGALAAGASLGPLARTVDDLALIFDALTRVDRTHQRSLAKESPADESPAKEPGEHVAETLLRGLRVACYAGGGALTVTQETEGAVESAAQALAAAGMETDGTLPPEIAAATDLWLALFSDDVAGILRAEFAGREELAGGAVRAILRRNEVASGATPEDGLDAWAERKRLRASLLERMRETPLLVAPVGAVAAFAHGARRVEVGGEWVNTFRAFGYAQACNVFGLPSVCVPAGRTRGGLPVGVQIIGRPFEEQLVLAAARSIENALGGWQTPPIALPSGGDFPL
ncbi:MAG TPA: amidase [Pyrinomonadaceae bacterium]|nr:amidase [Pyrinomonadaceae bacterium]